MSTQVPVITAVAPSLGVPGGEVRVNCRGFRPGLPDSAQVLFGEVRADIIAASDDHVTVRIPENPASLGVQLRVGTTLSELHPFLMATRIATDLHPVTSPVIAPGGSVITTISGSRGQQIPQPLVRVNRSGEKFRFPSDIMNPTGLAFGPDGQLYISSRQEGVVFRYVDFEDLEPFAEDMGIACGLAFDSKGNLYVGDRSGKVHRVDRSGHREEFVRLEPSVSAYHLAMDGQDRLYVTAPTFSLRDVLYRVLPSGKVEVVYTGLARPQGMAFLPDGDLLLTASYGGRKGVFRFSSSREELTHYVAGPMLVGVAASGGDVFVADGSSLYWLQQASAQPRYSQQVS